MLGPGSEVHKKNIRAAYVANKVVQIHMKLEFVIVTGRWEKVKALETTLCSIWKSLSQICLERYTILSNVGQGPLVSLFFSTVASSCCWTVKSLESVGTVL